MTDYHISVYTANRLLSAMPRAFLVERHGNSVLQPSCEVDEQHLYKSDVTRWRQATTFDVPMDMNDCADSKLILPTSPLGGASVGHVTTATDDRPIDFSNDEHGVARSADQHQSGKVNQYTGEL